MYLLKSYHLLCDNAPYPFFYQNLGPGERLPSKVFRDNATLYQELKLQRIWRSLKWWKHLHIKEWPLSISRRVSLFGLTRWQLIQPGLEVLHKCYATNYHWRVEVWRSESEIIATTNDDMSAPSTTEKWSNAVTVIGPGKRPQYKYLFTYFLRWNWGWTE